MNQAMLDLDWKFILNLINISQHYLKALKSYLQAHLDLLILSLKPVQQIQQIKFARILACLSSIK